MTASSGQIRIFIIDDHPVFREGLGSLLASQADLEVVGEVASGEAAIQALPRLHPDVVLLDLRLPGKSGLETLRWLRAHAPDSKPLVLTSSDSADEAKTLLAAGASGYLTKQVGGQEIFQAIRDVHAGKNCGTKGVRLTLPPPEVRAGLTAREVEVLGLVRQGHGNEEIGTKLGISLRTAKGHVAAILEKLAAADRAEAVARAYELGIFQAPQPG